MSPIRVVRREHERASPRGFIVLACLFGHLACTAPNPEFAAADVPDASGDARSEAPPEPSRDGAAGPADHDTGMPPEVAPPAVDAAPVRDLASPGDVTPKPGLDLNTGLIGYWKFDETSGTTAADSSRSGNTGTLEDIDPTTAWVAGRKGGGALKVTSNPLTSGVRVARTPAIDGIKKFTIAAWVFLTGGATDFQTVLSRQIDNSDGEVFSVAFASQILTLYLPRMPGLSYFARATAITPLSQWVHVAATFDGTTGRLYSDGVEVARTTYTGTLTPATTPLYLGTNKNVVSANQPLRGLVDDLLMYDVALSAEKIKALADGAVPTN
jgi:hypothetical protein